MMNHIEIKETENISEESYQKNLSKVKLKLEESVGTYDLEHAEFVASKVFNNTPGLYNRYKILKNNELIAFLETFKSKNLIQIYTSPVNLQ
ncbi:hypothetical protein [Tenacibaculum maritimum]|uniref:Uncharacterized protein n=2 Tax=Tenacibaculum maritimum TaxID=107401 RepID=A0A2H1EB36_9FLAO|nr:hypothetical protein [Tenacibaculum maritimum]MCD9564010.1 hypothetical protein [Tenacibaculum maritimum]MCD9566913.1 hypothetical protein [Tenacibaculum maritimum]MCD9580192.1 hypothetical protein [Tenacibaculum maritimum]MCD9585946.1 hypothetical protein [Tenacibaculum maritimum]MCD9597855.1 hypothetical protein [Tenacibaculum maritimum]